MSLLYLGLTGMRKQTHT